MPLLTLSVVFVLPKFIVVAFVVPMVRVVTLLSMDSNFAVDELSTETFVVPSIVFVEVAVPMARDPLVKLLPIVIVEVAELAFMIFTDKVDTFRDETFVVEKFCVPSQVFERVFT